MFVPETVITREKPCRRCILPRRNKRDKFWRKSLCIAFRFFRLHRHGSTAGIDQDGCNYDVGSEFHFGFSVVLHYRLNIFRIRYQGTQAPITYLSTAGIEKQSLRVAFIASAEIRRWLLFCAFFKYCHEISIGKQRNYTGASNRSIFMPSNSNMLD